MEVANELDQAWEWIVDKITGPVIKSAKAPTDHSGPTSGEADEMDTSVSEKEEEAEVLRMVSILRQNFFLEPFHLWYVQHYRQLLAERIFPKFWDLLKVTDLPLSKDMNTLDRDHRDKMATRFVTAVNYLHAAVYRALIMNQILENSCDTPKDLSKLRSELFLLLQVQLRASMKPALHDYVYLVYKMAFEIWNYQEMEHIVKAADESVDEEAPLGHFSSMIFSYCQEAASKTPENIEQTEDEKIFNQVKEAHSHLLDMQLTDYLVEDVAIRVVYQYLKDLMESRLQPVMTKPCLRELKDWLTSTLSGWFLLLVPGGDAAKSDELVERFTYSLYESYGTIRLRQIFEIIIDYPDSKDSLDDLKLCMDHWHGFRAKLIEAVATSLQTRLLHQGVNTTEIITGYISTIKSLRYLDSSGVVLQLVSEPVRKYLRSREDTVRCIITALTEDEGAELAQDLARSPDQRFLAEGYQEETITFANWAHWNPDPIEALATSHTSHSLRSSDILTILINIYEGKDMFVQEYQKLLSLRLLSTFEYCDLDGEFRNLELLTLRFGENDFNACEVMLKDIQSSRKINHRIKDEILKDQMVVTDQDQAENTSNHIPVSCLILSNQFWPEKSGIQSTDDPSYQLKLPDEAQKLLDQFTTGYEAIKANRTLEWAHNLGKVGLELELNGKTVNFSVSPAHAAIIYLFESQPTWTINQMSLQSGLPPSVIRKKILYWTSRGIIIETGEETYQLVDDTSALANRSALSEAVDQSTDLSMMVDDDEGDELNDSKALRRNAQDERVWLFIKHMLSNFKSLGMDRLHSLLQKFLEHSGDSSTQANYTPNDLRIFFEGKIREGKLALSNGEYQLPSTTS